MPATAEERRLKRRSWWTSKAKTKLPAAIMEAAAPAPPPATAPGSVWLLEADDLGRVEGYMSSFAFMAFRSQEAASAVMTEIEQLLSQCRSLHEAQAEAIASAAVSSGEMPEAEALEKSEPWLALTERFPNFVALVRTFEPTTKLTIREMTIE